MEYVLSKKLENAIKISEITQRPLLIKGEPGTGKTMLAHHYARKNNKEIFEWNIKSTSKAEDGLYFYDALTRLNDSRFENKSGRNVENPEDYIFMRAMGKSFSTEEKSILLIDEIDKADIEFPNDLLAELDKMEFLVKETGRVVKAKKRPLVFITSNNERDLPDAFLRRCIFHYIEFPDWGMMQEIVAAHFKDIDEELMSSAMNIFYRMRNIDDLSKRPSTSELIDWISVLLGQGVDAQKGLEYLGAMIKNEKDYELIKQCF